MIRLSIAKKGNRKRIVQRNSFLGSLLFFLLFAFSAGSIYSQWECPSRLNGFLKPLSFYPSLSWSTEAILGFGQYNDYDVNHYAMIAGLEYSLKNHSLFLRGGFKAWNRETELNGKSGKIDNNGLGLKTAEYSYNKNKFNIGVGLREFSDPNFFFINERAWGAFIAKQRGIKIIHAAFIIREACMKRGSRVNIREHQAIRN